MTTSPTPDELNSILDWIPGNRHVFETLSGYLDKKKALGFVGAGASFPLYPFWGQLIGQLADLAVNRGLAAPADATYWKSNALTDPLRMASQIRRKLTDGIWFEFLFNTFGEKTTSTGESFTPSHAALVSMNLKGLITTNYDPGLLEARKKLRPQLNAPGFTVWNQQFKINRWADLSVFEEPDSLPLLFAHGHYSDPENLVLDKESYDRAYDNTPWLHCFQNLWVQEHLIFVGFSLSDVVLNQLADDVLGRTVRKGGSGPRHIAVLGMPENEPYSVHIRGRYLDSHNAEVMLYPIRETEWGWTDHSALSVLLAALAR